MAEIHTDQGSFSSGEAQSTLKMTLLESALIMSIKIIPKGMNTDLESKRLVSAFGRITDAEMRGAILRTVEDMASQAKWAKPKLTLVVSSRTK